MTTGLCECGCGQVTPVASRNRYHLGHTKGEHLRFINGHNSRGRRNWSWTVDENDCWHWNGYVQSNGYGKATAGPGRMTYAHRAIYEALVGPIPAGHDLDHLCRNRDCVNPAHLEPVTRAENLRRGRAARREPTP